MVVTHRQQQEARSASRCATHRLGRPAHSKSKREANMVWIIGDYLIKLALYPLGVLVLAYAVREGLRSE